MLELKDGNVNVLIPDEALTAIQETLEKLLDSSDHEVNLGVLIDTAGKVIAYAGESKDKNLTTIAALAAGDYATTKEVAKKVGEKSFSLIFQRDKQLSAYLQSVSEETLLIILFEHANLLGQIRAKVKETQNALKRILDRCEKKVVGLESFKESFYDDEEAGPDEQPAAGQDPAAPVSPILVRKIWRIKNLIEDSLATGIDKKYPEVWKELGAKVQALIRLQTTDQREKEEELAVEIEAGLLKAYEKNLAPLENTAQPVKPGKPAPEPAGQRKDSVPLVFFNSLIEQSNNIFTAQLGEHAQKVLDHVDRPLFSKNYFLLDKTGPEAQFMFLKLDASRILGDYEEKDIFIYSFFDFLRNRFSIAKRIFGDEAALELYNKWRMAIQKNIHKVHELEMVNKINWFLEEIKRMSQSSFDPDQDGGMYS